MKEASLSLISCGGCSAVREAVELPSAKPSGPRRGKPAVRQPSPSASERQSHATDVPFSQFCFIGHKLLVYIGKQGGFARDFP